MALNGWRLSIKQAARLRDAVRRLQVGLSNGESSGALDAVLAVAMDAVITIDGRGRIRQLNRAAESMFGYSREQALGRTVAELVIPPQQRQAHRDALKRAVAGGAARILDRRVVMNALHADGGEFPVEMTVTRTEQSPPEFTAWIRPLGASEALLRWAFDHAPTGMSVVAPDGKWLRVNDAYCEMLGYERGELYTRRFETSPIPTMWPRTMSSSRRSTRSGRIGSSVTGAICTETVRSCGCTCRRK